MKIHIQTDSARVATDVHKHRLTGDENDTSPSSVMMMPVWAGSEVSGGRARWVW